MQHVFSQIPKVRIPRSLFRRNHNLKTTMWTDYLVPIYVDEALPGDTFKLKQNLFGRLSTPVVPLMDNLYLDTFYFAVPIRLIDDNWQKFMGERPFGDTTTEYVTPVLNTGTGVAAESLSDYMGIPINVPNLDFCAYWHRAYNLIFNEWFRDENLVEPRPVAGKHYDGTVSTEALSDYVLCKRGKRHDYFTSALPWPQKGQPVSISLGNTAPVRGFGKALPLTDGTNQFALSRLTLNGGATSVYLNGQGYDLNNELPNVGDTDAVAISQTTSNTKPFVGLDTNVTDAGLVADLSVASPVTINQLREAFAIQSLLEVDARSGTRYIEIIRGHFGVISPDARMQRPEFLGGSSEPLNVTTVPQTSSTDTTSPQGNLAAFITARNSQYWSKSFTEHCVIIGLANVRADLSYQQGLPRMFSRRTRYDFYWPELANLGEQAVLNKEIYAQGGSVTDSDGNLVDDGVFGYQERWAEYRYHPNYITGKFRSTYPESLDYWHLAQKFENLPKLNADFIQESVPISRAVAVQDEPPLILDGWFQVECARPMPLYSVPSIGRRF